MVLMPRVNGCAARRGACCATRLATGLRAVNQRSVSPEAEEMV
jgi:hypothetical protein